MKRLLAIAGVLIMMMTMLVGCGGGSGDGSAAAGSTEDTYELRLATDLAPEHFAVVKMTEVCDQIEEATDGHVKITVYPGGQLGSYNDLYVQLKEGDLDMQMGWVDPAYDERLYCGIFPALFKGFDGFVDNYLDKEGFMWNLLTDVENDMNLELVGCFNEGLMGIGMCKAPEGVEMTFANLVDPNVKKDLLIRCPAMDHYVATISFLGYQTTTIAYADLYPALQSGVADGWMGGTPISNWESFRDVIKYFLNAQLNAEILPIVINKDIMASMPEEYQTVIRDAFYNGSIEEAAIVEEESQKAMDNMEEYGITVIQPTDEELDAMIARNRESLWPQMEEIIGTETFEGLCEAFGVEL